MATGKTAPQVGGAMARAWRAWRWAMAQQRPGPPHAASARRVAAQALSPANGPRQRRRPGVVEPAAALRDRKGFSSLECGPAPDGGTEGGSQPTDSSVINRRHDW